MKTLDGVERPLQEGDVVIADGQRRDRARRRDGRRRERGLGRRRPRCCSRPRRSTRAPCAAPPSGWACTARPRTASSAASTPTASRTPAARAAAMLARLGGGALAGEGIDRYPQQAAPAPGDAVAGGPHAAGRLRDPARAGGARSWRRSASPARPTAPTTDRRHRPDLPPRHHDRGRSHRGGHAPRRLRPRAGAPAARQRRAGAQPRGARRSRARRAGGARARTRSSPGASCRAPGWRRSGGAARRRRSRVKNPISADYEVMRTSLLPGLVDAARRNLARGVPDVAPLRGRPGRARARRRSPRSRPPSRRSPPAILVGRRAGWLKPGEPLDFFDAKRVAERAAARARRRRRRFVRAAAAARRRCCTRASRPRSGAARARRRAPSGRSGEIHPRLAAALGLDARALYLEVALDASPASGAPSAASPPPRFPPSTRDVSFWIDAGVTADRAAGAAASRRPSRCCASCAVLEDYRDPRYAPRREEGDALDADLSGRRPDAHRRRGRRGPRQDRRGAEGRAVDRPAVAHPVEREAGRRFSALRVQ